MENIACLMAQLPEDYQEECINQGAITRMRGVDSPADLMMLVMFHLQNGCSLIEISEIAKLTKLGKMSDVAFMNRFEKCGKWFMAINEKLAASCLVDYNKPTWLENRTIVAVDASDVKEKGRSGRIYRLHFALDVLKMASLEHIITTNKTGESLCNFRIKPGQVVMGDRVYTSIKGIQHCINSGAEYILRMRKNNFIVRDDQGTTIDLLKLLKKLKTEEVADIHAFVTSSKGEKIPVRICAKRKTEEAILQTKKKLKWKESKNQAKFTEETKEFNEYIVLVTNLDSKVSAEEILSAYRLRWQVEIYFKRLKSILDFGELPKRREDSIFAWLNGKMMIALLIEMLIEKASFPPEGKYGQEPLARNEIY